MDEPVAEPTSDAIRYDEETRLQGAGGLPVACPRETTAPAAPGTI